jgi:glycosyltransferase involved in cell wall biosynthesis
MATYNGAAFVLEQLSSVLQQLDPQDEVVVVDDASSDDTVALVRSLGDGRIRVVELERNRGHMLAFEEAIGLARGEVIVLADQDDVWLPGRLDAMVGRLAADGCVVATNLTVFDGAGPVRATFIPLEDTDSGKDFRNIVGMYLGTRPYFGCAMAFRSDLRGVILPIPAYMEGHDLWIALVGNALGCLVHDARPSVARRLHGANLTADSRRRLPLVVRSRIGFTRALWEIRRRSRSRRG